MKPVIIVSYSKKAETNLDMRRIKTSTIQCSITGMILKMIDLI